MTINGTNYRLTKHGRARYLERVGFAEDSEIIRNTARGIPGYQPIWKPCRKEGYRLVTILFSKEPTC